MATLDQVANKEGVACRLASQIGQVDVRARVVPVHRGGQAYDGGVDDLGGAAGAAEHRVEIGLGLGGERRVVHRQQGLRVVVIHLDDAPLLAFQLVQPPNVEPGHSHASVKAPARIGRVRRLDGLIEVQARRKHAGAPEPAVPSPLGMA